VFALLVVSNENLTKGILKVLARIGRFFQDKILFTPMPYLRPEQMPRLPLFSVPCLD